MNNSPKYCPHCGGPISSDAVKEIEAKKSGGSKKSSAGSKAVWFFFMLFVAAIAFSVLTAIPK
jgi:hypothetical protein